MRLLVESVPVAAGLIGAGVELVWPRPARPGDVLTVESEVIERRELKSKPGYGIVRLRSITPQSARRSPAGHDLERARAASRLIAAATRRGPPIFT